MIAYNKYYKSNNGDVEQHFTLDVTYTELDIIYKALHSHRVRLLTKDNTEPEDEGEWNACYVLRHDIEKMNWR